MLRANERADYNYKLGIEHPDRVRCHVCFLEMSMVIYSLYLTVDVTIFVFGFDFQLLQVLLRISEDVVQAGTVVRRGLVQRRLRHAAWRVFNHQHDPPDRPRLSPSSRRQTWPTQLGPESPRNGDSNSHMLYELCRIFHQVSSNIAKVGRDQVQWNPLQGTR